MPRNLINTRIPINLIYTYYTHLSIDLILYFHITHTTHVLHAHATCKTLSHLYSILAIQEKKIK